MRSVLAFVLASLVLVSASSSRADELPMTPVPPPPAAAPSPDRLSPATALLLSLAGTGVGVGVLVVANDRDSATLTAVGVGVLDLGPSAGWWYAGDTLSPGMILRGLGSLGLAAGVSSTHCNYDLDSDCDVPGKMLVALSAFVLGAGVLADVVGAPFRADELNKRNPARFTIAPTALRASDGTVPGFALSGTF